MCSYNKVRLGDQKVGLHACENPETLQRDLKERMGFKGWVPTVQYYAPRSEEELSLSISLLWRSPPPG